MSEHKSDAAEVKELERAASNITQQQGQALDLDAPDEPSYHASYKLSVRTYLVLIAMGFTWGTCTMANIGPSTTSSGAASALGGESISSWIPNAALFSIIALPPVWGCLADRFGKKWFIAAGGIVGVVGNVVAGTAKSTEVIIAGQAINGIGSSLFLIVVPAGMEIVSASHRSFAHGLMGSINGLISIMVLLVSGTFAKGSTDGWRWVYYFNAIFFGSCALSMVALYHPPPTRLRRENSVKDSIKSVDLAGIALFLCGVIPIVVSLTWGGHAYPWDSPRVVSLLVVGIVFVVGFGVYEAYGRKDGLLDHRFFQGRNYSLILAVAFVDGMLLYGVNAFLPQEIGGLFTHDQIMISVYLLPLNICVIIGIMSSTYILGALRHYRSLLVSSMALISLFCGLLALVNSSRLSMLLVFTGLIGFGVGVTTALPNIIVTYSVPSHLIGTSGTLMASCRALGGIIGITIFASINGNYMATGDTPLDDISGVTPTIITAAKHALESITAEAFKSVWIANAAIGVAATM
ncbi:hypothetical protein FDECE_4315, partial [Fusarium decemcellulare]